jgi:hypothetical protein
MRCWVRAYRDLGVLAVVCLLLGLGNLRAQEAKTIFGRLTHPTESTEGVHVQNVSLRKFTIGDAQGYFSIVARKGDSLKIHGVQFDSVQLQIKEKHYSSVVVTVPLKLKVTQLPGVVLQPYNLSGRLQGDLDSLALAHAVDEYSLGLPNAKVAIKNQTQRRIYEADHGKFVNYYGIALTVNLHKILNRLSGRTNRLKSKQGTQQRDAMYELVFSLLPDSAWARDLKIPLSKFGAFRYYCESDNEFQVLVENGEAIELMDFLVEKSQRFKESTITSDE